MIRFGIVGFGLHAVKRLMPGFAEAKRCRVSALSRRKLEEAKASAKQFGVALAFDSAEELCKSKEVDAVFIATPNSSHLGDVLLALRHGKPVLVEKPMGMNAGECKKMVEAAHKAKLPLGVAQVFRFEDSTARLRERVAAQEVGKVTFARSEFSYPGRAHARTWLNQRAIAGGGPIADVGVHCIDTLRFILQDEVLRVSARTTADRDSGDVEAAGILSLEFGRGALGAVLVSTRAAYRTPLEIVGEKGVLRAEDALSVEHPIRIELMRNEEIVDSERISNHLAYARQVDAFAEAVEGKAAFPAPGEEGWTNQMILDAAYRSAKSGKVEKVSG
ncbi:MAG TPA: Gfo/Idh/MocA family oxidoreductase [Terriglobales bacterium]|nr:Gfo/Idh/MocA family oxidoreductase [Terriglobales bacterium]